MEKITFLAFTCSTKVHVFSLTAPASSLKAQWLDHCRHRGKVHPWTWVFWSSARFLSNKHLPSCRRKPAWLSDCQFQKVTKLSVEDHLKLTTWKAVFHFLQTVGTALCVWRIYCPYRLRSEPYIWRVSSSNILTSRQNLNGLILNNLSARALLGEVQTSTVHGQLT